MCFVNISSERISTQYQGESTSQHTDKEPQTKIRHWTWAVSYTVPLEVPTCHCTGTQYLVMLGYHRHHLYMENLISSWNIFQCTSSETIEDSDKHPWKGSMQRVNLSFQPHCSLKDTQVKEETNDNWLTALQGSVSCPALLFSIKKKTKPTILQKGTKCVS